MSCMPVSQSVSARREKGTPSIASHRQMSEIHRMGGCPWWEERYLHFISFHLISRPPPLFLYTGILRVAWSSLFGSRISSITADKQGIDTQNKAGVVRVCGSCCGGGGNCDGSDCGGDAYGGNGGDDSGDDGSDGGGWWWMSWPHELYARTCHCSLLNPHFRCALHHWGPQSNPITSNVANNILLIHSKKKAQKTTFRSRLASRICDGCIPKRLSTELQNREPNPQI